MNRSFFLSFAILLLFLPNLAAQESLPERDIRVLIEEEQRILNGSQRADGSFDAELLERRFQGLVHKYDAFIHEHAEFPVGYIAYARVLERIGQRDAARALYMKANQLDPNIALVKNQLGNFLAEDEDFAQALPYFLAAIELEPEEPLYHYQLGNLLFEFRDGFAREKIFTRASLDTQILQAFQTAARLAPSEIMFAYRHAEAFYDLETPRWDEALRAWKNLEKRAAAGIETQTIQLHQAKVLIEQGKKTDARKLLAQIDEPILQRQKQKLTETLGAERD